MKKKFLLIALAAAFLIDPLVNINDYLPDFIGYLAILFAISGLARMEDYFGDAAKRFAPLALISAVKCAVSLIFPGMSDITRLLLAFSFAIAETVFFLPAAFGLLSGTGYLLSRHSDENSADPASLKGLTAAFFIVREICAFLPLIPALNESGGSVVYDKTESTWSQFTNLYYIFCAVLVLAVAIPWAVKFIQTFVRVSGDGDFIGKLSEKYEIEVLSHPKRLAAERLSAVMMLFVAACAFTFTFYIDNVNAFPNFISAALIFLCVVLLYEAPPGLRITGMASSLAWAVLAYVGMRLQRDFDAEGYSPEWALHDIGKSAAMYTKIEIFAVAEAVLFGAAAVMFALCLVKTVRCHIDADERYEGLRRPARFALIPTFILLGLAVAANLVQTPVMKYFPVVWMIGAAVTIALTVAAYRAAACLRDGLCHRMSV